LSPISVCFLATVVTKKNKLRVLRVGFTALLTLKVRRNIERSLLLSANA
jgi:hypothetical protein